MDRPSVRRETSGAVTTIILDRPERRNAVDPQTAVALRAAFREFERDREARIAVLWGAHGTFCAGYDLKALATGPRRLARAYGDGPMGPSPMRLGKPAIAAVAGSTVRLPAIVGLGCALALILTGRPVGAREAELIGLANRVVPQGTAREEAEALARIIAGFPPHCVRSDRRSAYESLGATLGRALRREHALGIASVATGESLAGAARFAAGAGRHGKF